MRFTTNYDTKPQLSFELHPGLPGLLALRGVTNCKAMLPTAKQERLESGPQQERCTLEYLRSKLSPERGTEYLT